MQVMDRAHASEVLNLPQAPIKLTPLTAQTAVPSATSPLVAPRSTTTNGGPLTREVFGFAPYWALASSSSLDTGDLSDLQYDKLSTVAYFGLTFDSSGQFVNDAGMTGWNSSQLNQLVSAAHGNGDRVVVTAKSFNDADIYPIVSNPTYGQQAISNVISAVKARGLDGANIDFEGSTSSSYPNIQQDFTGWIQSLSAQLHQQVPGSFLTVDTYSGSASWNDGFMRIDTLAPYVDSFFVMAYDMGLSNASAQGQPGTLPNAPLSGNYNYTDTTSVDQYLQKTGDGNKVILGVPYYGYKFSTYGTGFNASIDYNTTGCVAACADPYSTILSEFACAPQLQNNWDGPSATPWASWYSPAQNDPCGANHGTYRELYYDSAASLGAKYDLVNSQNIRGAGIWALGMDHGSSDLWNAIGAHLENPCHTNANTNTLSSPHPTSLMAAAGMDCALYVHQGSTPGFTSLGGVLLAAPAVVPSGPTTDPFYVITGPDRNLYIRSGTAGWQSLTAGGPVGCVDNPAAVIVGGIFWVTCQGTDHALYAAQAPVPSSGLPQVSHSSWQSLGGGLLSGPAAVDMGGGVPTFFVIGLDNFVYVRTPTTTYSRQIWYCIGHPAAASSGSTTYFGCHGRDNALWYMTNSGSGWSGGTSLGGGLIDGPGIAAGTAGPTFYVEGLDAAVYERSLSTNWSRDGGGVHYGVGAAWIP